MNLIDSRTEQKLLLGVLECRIPKLRNYILAETLPDDYGSKFGIEVRERMDKLIQLDKPLGSAVDFSSDPGLSKNAKKFIRGTPKLRKAAKNINRKRINKLIDILKATKRARIAYDCLEKGAEVLEDAIGEKEIDEFCAVLEDSLVNLKKGFERQPLLHIGKGQSKEDLKNLTNRLTEKRANRFIPTGLEALDYYIKGFERGNLVTLSANSSGGKTAVALNMAINQYLAGYSVCFVSMEMRDLELLHRMLSRLTKTPHDIIRMQNDYGPGEIIKISKTLKKLRRRGIKKKARFTIWDVQNDLTPPQIELSLKPFKYDSLYIDYLTLLSHKFRDIWRMQLEYSRYFKGTCKRLDCITNVLTQMTEDDEIRYGRAVKENTDYWIRWQYGEEEEEEGETEFHLAKARHGKKRTFPVQFMMDKMTIRTRIEELPLEGGMSQR